MPISRASKKCGVPTSAPSPNDSGLSVGTAPPENHAVDMGVDELDRVRRKQALDQEFGAQPLRAVAIEVGGSGAVEDAHRHAASSDASAWIMPSVRQRIASAWP